MPRREPRIVRLSSAPAVTVALCLAQIVTSFVARTLAGDAARARSAAVVPFKPSSRAPFKPAPESTMPHSTMTAQTTVEGLTLSTTLVRYEDRIEVHYRVINGTRAPVAVLNQLFNRGPDGGWEHSPDNVFVYVEDGALHLDKAAPDIGTTFPSFNPDPGVEILRGGSETEETFTVPLPAKVRHQFLKYKRMAPDRPLVLATRRAVVREIVFSVGTVPVDARLGFHDHAAGAPSHALRVYPIHGVSVREYQTLLSARFAMDEDVPVLDYEARPWN